MQTMTNLYTYGERELLVIDDEPGMIRVVKDRILTKDFERKHSAANFEEGKEAIEKLTTPQSIIFSDFHLPGGVGLDLAKISHSTRKRLQIGMFIMSGGAAGKEMDMIEQAIQEGVIEGYLSKPFPPSQVKEVIKQFYQKIGVEL